MDPLIAAVDRPRGFLAPEAVRLTGATYRQLDYWARTDVLVPSVAAARGSGSRRRWSFTDLVALGALVAISAATVLHNPLDAFRRKALPLAIQMHVDVFDDWDCVIVLVRGVPELMPSLESAVNLICELYAEPSELISLVNIGPIARHIAEEVTRAEAEVR